MYKENHTGFLFRGKHRLKAPFPCNTFESFPFSCASWNSFVSAYIASGSLSSHPPYPPVFRSAIVVNEHNYEWASTQANAFRFMSLLLLLHTAAPGCFPHNQPHSSNIRMIFKHQPAATHYSSKYQDNMATKWIHHITYYINTPPLALWCC